MGSQLLATRCSGVLFVAALVFSMGAPPQTRKDVETGDKHLEAQRRIEKGIPNFAEVTPTLYRGGQPNDVGMEKLAKMGVDIVIDARGTERSAEGKVVRKLGMKYVAIPWHCPFPHDDVFVNFLTVLRDNPGKKVFVHCRLGEDRTGMMVAAYRMADEGWSAKEALDEMKKFGFTTVHQIICPRLQTYEEHFPGHLKNNPAFEGLRLPEGPGKSQ